MQDAFRAPGRALVLVLVVAGLAVPASAHAILAVNTQVTRGVVGYGTVHVSTTSATPPAECTSPQSTQGGTQANVNGGTEYDCATITGASYDHCTTSGTLTSCSLTLQAQVPDPDGWRFDHWSGTDGFGDPISCTTSTSCTVATRDSDCSDPPCITDGNGPYTVVAHFVDTRAPTTTLSTGPSNNAVVYSDTQAQSFTWSTNEDAESPTFQCKRDGGSFSACSSGYTWSSIADGIHDFCVYGTDASGLPGGDACRHWEQERNPTASIANKPPATSNSPDASFTYTSNKASHPADGSSLSYQCKLDGGAFASCPAGGKSYSSLADGSHTFQVQAVFTGALGGGAHTSAAASYTWTIDTTPPVLTFGSPTPAENSTVSSGDPHDTFAFSTNEPATFTCHLDGAAPAPCTSPVTIVVPNGGHGFYVDATDALGNHLEYSRHFTQATAPPETSIVSGPSEGLLTSDRGATFVMSSPEAGVTFQCSLDGAAFTTCPSTKTYGGLALGAHTFDVRAVDAAGNTDPTPAARSWRVTEADADGDGYPAGVDCNDANPAIHPGAVDVPGNGVDENCDGRDAAVPSVGGTVSAAWRFFKRYTKLSSLTISGLPSGATVVVSCRGKHRSCPFARRTLKASRAKLSFGKYFKRAKLAKGTRIEIRITKTGTTGVDVVFTTRNGKLPKKSQRALPKT